MKRFFFLLLVASSCYCSSQFTDEPVKVRFDLAAGAGSQDYNREFVIKGSPYLNEKHIDGTIINGTVQTKALLRYNAYYDSFQMLDKNKKKSFVIKSPNIQIALDGYTYSLQVYEETVKDKSQYYLPDNSNTKFNGNKREGYFRVIHTGKTILYLKIFKRVPKFKQVAHGYESFSPSAFLTIEHFYIKRKLRPATRIALSKKEVLIALSDKYNEVRSYIKKNKLKVKTQEEVIQVIEYYDTLD